MGKTTIEWCDYTMNPWRGCTKVSTGCANCYAETLASRFPETLGTWGNNGTRIIASESYWKQPLKWNRKAKEEGKRARVFCASMADVFEDRPELVEPRKRLFGLIACTPFLDWLILTKRPQNVMRLMHSTDWHETNLLDHIIWGTSVENQEQADKRIPELLKIPGRHFLSCEPLLGPVDVSKHMWPVSGWWRGQYSSYQEAKAAGAECGICRQSLVLAGSQFIDWVIVGGESGPKARPMHPDWARSLRDQCKEAGTPYFFKQWGEWFPRSQWEDNPELVLPDNVHELTPNIQLCPNTGQVFHKVVKKAAGRLLDGVEHNEFP